MSWVPEGDFLELHKDGVRPKKKQSFSYLLTSQPTRPRLMKIWSAEVPALKDLLDRPLDFGCLELADRAMRDAGLGGYNWSSFLANALRSLKSYGSSPEHMMDLLSLLHESSDEVLQKMDLDDFTVEHLTAGRSALQEVIRNVELAVKKGARWYCNEAAPWLWSLRRNGCCIGPNDLPILQAMVARASILMTRLEHEAQKENDTCSQEVA